MKISIGKAAKMLGVAQETLRRWEKTGKITTERTLKGHRRFDLTQLKSFIPNNTDKKKQTIAYARVSSHDQRADLIRQVNVLESFCANHGWEYEVLQDLGSGLNYDKKGLKKLIQKI